MEKKYLTNGERRFLIGVFKGVTIAVISLYWFFYREGELIYHYHVQNGKEKIQYHICRPSLEI